MIGKRFDSCKKVLNDWKNSKCSKRFQVIKEFKKEVKICKTSKILQG